MILMFPVRQTTEGATDKFYASFASRLRGGSILSAIIAVEEVDPDTDNPLTIGSESIVNTPTIINTGCGDEVMEIGQGISFVVSGYLSGRTYDILCTVSDTEGNTIPRTVRVIAK